MTAPAPAPSYREIAGRMTALDAELKVRAERSLSSYTRQAWHIVEPGTDYLHNWHIDAMAEALEAVTAGQILRLLINIPPRYMKSTMVSIMWPTWEWQLHPPQRWMFTSYSGDLSLEHSVTRRLIIQSEWYQNRWGAGVKILDEPTVCLVDDQNEKGKFRNTARGAMFATSMTGSATGMGGNRLVVDDPHNPKRAESAKERETDIKSFDGTFHNRLDDKNTGSIVIVMQRLNAGDLSGHVLAQRLHGAPVYTHLNIEGIAENPTTYTFPRTGRVVSRPVGDVLWPARENAEKLALQKIAMGSYAFAGQYQQRPAPEGGGRFKRSWFQYADYDPAGFYTLHRRGGAEPLRVPTGEMWKFSTCDLALSIKEEACWTVLATWAVTRFHDCILIDVLRERMEAPDAESAMKGVLTRHNPSFLGVEKAHYGVAIVQKFLREGLPVKELIADRDKLTRSMTASVLFEAGKFYFLRNTPWLGEYEAELLFFPKGDFDDQVDVTSYAGLIMAADGAMSVGDIVRGRTLDTAAPMGPTGLPRAPRRFRWGDVSG